MSDDDKRNQPEGDPPDDPSLTWYWHDGAWRGFRKDIDPRDAARIMNGGGKKGVPEKLKDWAKGIPGNALQAAKETASEAVFPKTIQGKLAQATVTGPGIGRLGQAAEGAIAPAGRFMSWLAGAGTRTAATSALEGAKGAGEAATEGDWQNVGSRATDAAKRAAVQSGAMEGGLGAAGYAIPRLQQLGTTGTPGAGRKVVMEPDTATAAAQAASMRPGGPPVSSIPQDWRSPIPGGRVTQQDTLQWQNPGTRQITPAGAADMRGAASAVAGDKGTPGEYIPPVVYRLMKTLGFGSAGVSGSRYLNH